VVTNIEHTNSTYQDMTDADYVTSFVYRPEDILFVIDELPKVISNADNTNVGLIGYSYGCYSVVRAAGVSFDLEGLNDFCERTNNENPCFAAEFLAGQGDTTLTPDPRIKAVFVMAPYGQPWFGEAALATLTPPLFVAVGDADDIALYDRDGLAYFQNAGSKEKYLLTLEGAQHNSFAECPESLRGKENCFDPVWEQAQVHDLMKHFAAAFFGEFLRGDTEDAQYLTP
jgi:predicted dienelactone hydrolase